MLLLTFAAAIVVASRNFEDTPKGLVVHVEGGPTIAIEVDQA
jgi:hypothetical protein